jgi:hypothetical protein
MAAMGCRIGDGMHFPLHLRNLRSDHFQMLAFLLLTIWVRTPCDDYHLLPLLHL